MKVKLFRDFLFLEEGYRVPSRRTITRGNSRYPVPSLLAQRSVTPDWTRTRATFLHPIPWKYPSLFVPFRNI